jgi:excisionase family DNA binding protein
MDVIHTLPCQAALSVPLAVRVKQACELIGIGRSKLYELVAEGEIETIKVGSATLIPMTSLARFVESRRNAS